MHEKNSKLNEAVIQVTKLVDEIFGACIEQTVRDTGKPELRPVLKALFFRYVVLEHAIKRTKYVEEFEREIENAAELLSKRIAESQQKIAYLSEIKKASLREERAKLTQEFYSTSLDVVTDLPDDQRLENDDLAEVRKTAKETDRIANEAFAAFEEVFDGFEEFQNTLAFMDQHGLESGLRKFRKWRKVRKARQSLLRLFWSVILFGCILGLIVSGITKLLALQSIAILALVGLVVAFLKEYKIGPWLREKRFRSQRADLLLSLKDFMIADLTFTILSTMKENRRKKKMKAAMQPMIEEIEKEFSDTGQSSSG